jgi:hypothetical protein
MVHPILVPGETREAELLIWQAHADLAHTGSDWVKAELRRPGFYLVPGSSCVCKVVRSCVFCQLSNSKPLEAPLAHFHGNRFQEEGSFPFPSIGMDHFGSLAVYPTKKDRRAEESWGLLFFCLVTRAVHLEVVEYADVESFLLVYGRFTALRGTPKEVGSWRCRRVFWRHWRVAWRHWRVA